MYIVIITNVCFGSFFFALAFYFDWAHMLAFVGTQLIAYVFIILFPIGLNIYGLRMLIILRAAGAGNELQKKFALYMAITAVFFISGVIGTPVLIINYIFGIDSFGIWVMYLRFPFIASFQFYISLYRFYMSFSWSSVRDAYKPIFEKCCGGGKGGAQDE